MARVFAQDVLKAIPECNRAELILLAAQYARTNTLGKGSRAVQALRDIEAGKATYSEMKESLLEKLQQVKPTEIRPEED